MSKGQTLRVLVNARLTAAAEEIFALFERTIAEYEEELCRSKEKNQRKQELLESVLSPREVLLNAGVQVHSTSPGPGLNQDLNQTPQIKEEPVEQSIEQEEEQLPVQSQDDHHKYNSSRCHDASSVLFRRNSQISSAITSGQRASVNERMTVTAEEIFALFERTIAEYEVELYRSKEENQRKQELLESVLSPRVVLFRGDVQIHSVSPGSGLNQGLNLETPRIKEEPSVKQEEEQLPVQLPVADLESSAVCVKTEEFSQLQQRQTEHKEETQKGDISTEQHLHSETEGDMQLSSDTDDSENWRPPFSSSVAQMETESDGDDSSQVEIRARSTAPQNSGLSPKDKCTPETSDAVNKGDMSGTAKGAEGKKHQCAVCQKRFQSKQTLRRHCRVHTGESPFNCLICKKTFSQRCSLDLHLRLHTGEKPFSCSMCNKSFSCNLKLNAHVKVHTEGPYSCSTCEKEFALKTYLAAHMKIHTSERPYSCSICAKTFIKRSRRDMHMRTHTVDRPYSCSVCNKRYTQMDNLKTHMKTHADEKPYSCSTCEKAFPTNGHLKKHMRWHTVKKSYSCSTCEKAFVTKDALDIHMRKHTGEKPFNCSTCEKAFAAKNGLVVHMRTHTGEKPYSCSTCEKAFAAKGQLDTHKRTHTGEKPYNCSICEKAFAVKSHLDTHMRTHTGEKPYACSTCEKAFAAKSHLKKHMRWHTNKQTKI